MDGSQKEKEKKHFFINICHRVLQEGQARGCPEDAAVCSVGEPAQRGTGALGARGVSESPCGLSPPPSLGSAHKGWGENNSRLEIGVGGLALVNATPGDRRNHAGRYLVISL